MSTTPPTAAQAQGEAVVVVAAGAVVEEVEEATTAILTEVDMVAVAGTVCIISLHCWPLFTDAILKSPVAPPPLSSAVCSLSTFVLLLNEGESLTDHRDRVKQINSPDGFFFHFRRLERASSSTE